VAALEGSGAELTLRRGEAVDLLGHRDRARLPAAKSDDGKWAIDPAELRRVYP